jgi:hypothetical protein
MNRTLIDEMACTAGKIKVWNQVSGGRDQILSLVAGLR